MGEQTLESAGLGSMYTPVGWVQNALELMHVYCGIPWWGAIIAGKLCTVHLYEIVHKIMFGI